MKFIDLQTQFDANRAAIEQRIHTVLEHGQFILGPEVGELECDLAGFCGVPYAVSCSSGTDALLLALMLHGIGPGDAVFVPSFTFVSTAEAVALLGATPVFVDIDADTYLMAEDSLARALEAATAAGLKPAGLMPVDLFGQPADYPSLLRFAAAAGMHVIADAAQSFGGTLDGQRVGSLAPLTATSFFPAKPLGCFGDGGALFTDSAELADIALSLRVHGKGNDKYDNIRVGINGRMDTIQAAVLIEKLKMLPEELVARDRVASRYTEGLAEHAATPVLARGATSAWAQYTIRVADRDGLAAALKEHGIPTAVYYPIPLHRQQAYRHYPSDPAGMTVSEQVAAQVISLPMHPYLAPTDQDRVIDAVVAYARGGSRAAAAD